MKPFSFVKVFLVLADKLAKDMVRRLSCVFSAFISIPAYKVLHVKALADAAGYLVVNVLVSTIFLYVSF